MEGSDVVPKYIIQQVSLNSRVLMSRVLNGRVPNRVLDSVSTAQAILLACKRKLLLLLRLWAKQGNNPDTQN